MKTKSLLAACTTLLLAASLPAQTPVPAATPAAPATPADAIVFNQQSIERLQQKNAKEAVELAEKATKADPTKAEYFSQLGIALSQRMNEVPFMQMPVFVGKLKRAFEKAVALDPNNIPGLIGLARFYSNAPEMAGGSPAKAAEFAARLQKINAFLGEIEFGHIAEHAEKYDEALTHFTAASNLQPDNAGLQYACGSQLAQLGRKDEARVRFTTALKLKPDFEAAKNSLAELDAPAPAPVAPPAK